MPEVRLIDSNALIGFLHNQTFIDGDDRSLVYRWIDEQPTIEAELVQHGRWINNTFCSECNRFPVDVSVPISNQELTKYFTRCPHCGARMNGGFEGEGTD